MKHGRKALICVLGGVIFCADAYGISSGNPYQGIVDRNVFGLKPPPPPPDPEANKPPPPNITLTGITTILGRKQALMETPPAPGAKPGSDQAKKQFYILTVGQREGDIEVLDIDEVAGVVKVKNGGNEVTLNFKDNGPKIPSTPPPGPIAGIPAPGGIPVPTAGVVPPPPSTFPTGTGLRTIPTRTLRLPDGANTGSGVNPGVGAAGTVSQPGAVSLGGVTMPLGAQAGQPTSEPTQAFPQRTPEENAILYEANRLRNEQLANQGLRPRMPPHILFGGQQQQGAQPVQNQGRP